MKRARLAELKENAWYLHYIYHKGMFMASPRTKYFETEASMQDWIKQFKERNGDKTFKLWEHYQTNQIRKWYKSDNEELKRIDEDPGYFSEGLDRHFYYNT